MRKTALAVALAFALSACSGDDEPQADEEEAGATTTEATEPTTSLSPQAEVEAAFWEWDAVMTELSAEPNPDDPRLAELITEPELSHIRESLREQADKNQAFELGEESQTSILSTTVDPGGETSTVVVCAVAADTLIDRDTGDVVNEGDSTIKFEASYQIVDGVWKVSDVEYIESWEGITSCDG